MSFIFGYIINVLTCFEFLNTVKFYRIMKYIIYGNTNGLLDIGIDNRDNVINLDYYREV